MKRLKNSDIKWIAETEDCSLSDYKLYIFLQQILVIIHSKLFIYFITLVLQFIVILFFSDISTNSIAIGLCTHLFLFINIVNNPEFKKNKLDVEHELNRLVALRLNKKRRIKNA